MVDGQVHLNFEKFSLFAEYLYYKITIVKNKK